MIRRDYLVTPIFHSPIPEGETQTRPANFDSSHPKNNSEYPPAVRLFYDPVQFVRLHNPEQPSW